eukprot:10214836-Alexandrium_andersonii.AAC.1
MHEQSMLIPATKGLPHGQTPGPAPLGPTTCAPGAQEKPTERGSAGEALAPPQQGAGGAQR